MTGFDDMQKIPLMTAAAGMVLARDVYRDDTGSGMPICGKGTVLSDSLIRRLEHLGVQSLHIEGGAECAARSLDDLLCDLDKRFAKVQDHDLSGILREVYEDYLKRTLGEGNG